MSNITKLSAHIALAIVALFGLISVSPLTRAALAQTRPVDDTQTIAPNSLGLASFSAKLDKKNKVILTWDTGTELTILGFNIQRRTAKGQYQTVNAEMVPAQNTGEIIGNAYKLKDSKVKKGKVYFYQLELVSTQGYSALSEEVRIKVK